MQEVEVVQGQQEVRRVRKFESLYASETRQELRVGYIEQMYVGNELMRSELKFYSRDYAMWSTNELGTSILDMIALDLALEDPQTLPSNETTEE